MQRNPYHQATHFQPVYPMQSGKYNTPYTDSMHMKMNQI